EPHCAAQTDRDPFGTPPRRFIASATELDVSSRQTVQHPQEALVTLLVARGVGVDPALLAANLAILAVLVHTPSPSLARPRRRRDVLVARGVGVARNGAAAAVPARMRRPSWPACRR